MKDDKVWGQMKNQIIITELTDGKWSIARTFSSGGENIIAKNFDEMVYRTIEAIVKTGHEPKEG